MEFYLILNDVDFIKKIRRDLGQATINTVIFSETQINGDQGIALVITKTTITFTAGRLPAQTLTAAQ